VPYLGSCCVTICVTCAKLQLYANYHTIKLLYFPPFSFPEMFSNKNKQRTDAVSDYKIRSLTLIRRL
jgi:hypothetical protein